MNERVRQLSGEIQKLSSEEQALLLDELLIATYEHPDPDIEKVWAEEAERRHAAHDRGERTTTPFDQVMTKLRTRL